MMMPCLTEIGATSGLVTRGDQAQMNPLTITILYSLFGNQYCTIMLNSCPILGACGRALPAGCRAPEERD